jgi:hypothetical protein
VPDAKRAKAERKAIAKAQKIVAIWNTPKGRGQPMESSYYDGPKQAVHL